MCLLLYVICPFIHLSVLPSVFPFPYLHEHSEAKAKCSTFKFTYSRTGTFSTLQSSPPIVSTSSPISNPLIIYHTTPYQHQNYHYPTPYSLTPLYVIKNLHSHPFILRISSHITMNTPSSQHHVTNPAYTWSELLLFLEELITKDEKDRPFHQPPSILLFSDPFQPHTEQDLLQNKCMQALGANENFHFSQLSSPDATSIHPSLPSPSSPPVLSLHPRQSQKIIKKHSVNPATSYSSAVSGRKKTFVCPYEDCGKV